MEQKKIFKTIILSITTVFLLSVILLISSVVTLRWANPSFTSFTLRENWEELDTERYNLKEWWVPRQQIPEHLKWAVIASEDQRYMDHFGFDIESIKEAIEEQREGKRTRGASTISQQTAKNLYLWQEASYLRKGLEAGITLLLELILTKERVLEIYLNTIEFGPGIFGVGKASEEWFGIHASELEPDMSARLAAVLPSPKRMRVEPPSPFAQERSQWVLRQMSRMSGISYVQADSTEQLDEPDDIDPFPWDSISVFIDQSVRTDTSSDTSGLTPLRDSLLHKHIRPDTLYNPANDTLQRFRVPDSLQHPF